MDKKNYLMLLEIEIDFFILLKSQCMEQTSSATMD